MLPSSILFLIFNFALCLGCVPTYNSEEATGGPFTTTVAGVAGTTTGTSTGGTGSTTATGGSTTSAGTTSTGSTTTTSTTTTTTTPACLSGWVFLPLTMSCYLAVDLGTPSITQPNAETQCLNYPGAHLASTHSDQESSFILSLFSNNLVISIGIYRTGLLPTDFAWYDNSPLTYTKWASYPPTVQPDNSGGNEYCAGMFKTAGYAGNGALLGVALEWNDHACSFLYQNYVCKMPKL